MTRKDKLAVVLNFFMPGLGHLVAGLPSISALLMIAGAVVLTYVELTLETLAPRLHVVMFVAVFALNTGLAIDLARRLRSLAAARA
ncbi:MAG: hypothetical protein K1X88_19440 [Nannocystaceae bacterium]|nr:hypothetical protein [Nannocystaceae bacterium]